MNIQLPSEGFFEVFPWNKNFETGIAIIDDQHKELVRLLNLLAAHMGEKSSELRLSKVLDDLAAYAGHHFQTEEKIWQQGFKDDPWFISHEHSHRGFERQLIEMQEKVDGQSFEDTLEVILSFLINWLAFHILDHDMRMAKALDFMKEGAPVDAAKAQAAEAMGGTMQKLIEAILAMYGKLSTRTLDLMKERTERRRVEKELERSQKREQKISDALMGSIPGVLYLYDTDLRLVRWNKNLNAITGYSDDELAGKSAFDFLPPEQHAFLNIAVDRALHDGYQEFEGSLLLKNGTALPYKLTGVATSIRGERFYAGVGIDISQEKKTEEHLIASRNMLEDAQRIAHLGHWTMYHDTGRIFWSDEMFRILGLEEEQDTFTPSYDGFMALVHADDRDKVNSAFQGAIDARQPYNTMHRVALTDGTVKYVEGRGATEYDKHGKPVKSMGTLHDITPFVQAERSAAKHAEEAKQALIGTVSAVAKALEARDPYTAGHQARVATIAVRIAERLKLSPHRIEGISLGARIHDLGKIGVPAELLSKPTRLSDMEYGLIKSHAQSGAEILQDISFPWPIREIIAQHHERLDGSGYPNGLKGDEICFEARIVAVADVYEAMSAHRPYRASLGVDNAIAELQANKGVIYDETVVSALLEMIEEDPEPFMP